MASIQVRKETNCLIIDFYWNGQRCREQTALPDTPANRKKLEKFLERIEFDIKTGTFDYAKTFPGSRMAAKFANAAVRPQFVTVQQPVIAAAVASTLSPQGASPRPTFDAFADTWVSENEINWRRSHRRTIDDILKSHLRPAFGSKVVDEITKADILSFRSTLAKVPGRKGPTLTAKRINAIMAPVRQILNEAADRFDFTTPYRNIKPLKQLRTDVEPFSLSEVQTILHTVRSDFRNYYLARFFTGMRTGEIDGLKWAYIDFERRQILVRETIVDGEEDITKTDGSRREITMSQVVFDALQAQAKVTRRLSPYVFCNGTGQPLDHNNVTKRVWYPLLRHLGLKSRRPYQTRHTAATLWLASGENPLWIARQLGHSSTEMLFKVYGRFAPNLTRQDGSAFERLLVSSGAGGPAPGLPLPAVAAAAGALTATGEACHG
jgi:integrase